MLSAKIKELYPEATDEQIAAIQQEVKDSSPDAWAEAQANAAAAEQAGAEQYKTARQELVDQKRAASSNMGNRAAGFLGAFGAGIAGRGSEAAYDNILSGATKPIQEDIDALDKSRQGDIAGQERVASRAKTSYDMNRKMSDDQRTDDTRKREKDPSSAESKLAQGLATKMVPGYDFSKMSASQINEKIPSLQKIYDIEQKRLEKDEERKDKALARAEAQADRKERASEREHQQRTTKQDSDVQKLSKEVQGAQASITGLDAVEAELGFSLDDATVKDGKLIVGGKEKDLPGVSVPGYGRVNFYDSDARNLQGAAAGVFNSVLKDRSGAAVSNTEMARLKKEFGEGSFNTEAEIVTALQRYKKAVNTELQNREAGFNQGVRDKYKEQGGRTSQSTVTKPHQDQGEAGSQARQKRIAELKAKAGQ